MITDEQLRQIMPSSTQANRNKYLMYFNLYLNRYEINTPLRIAAFMAQIGHESGSLRYVKELAGGEAYTNMAKLGNARSEAVEIAKSKNMKTGPFYKGRGLIQITGYDNYLDMGKRLELDLTHNPDLLGVPQYAVQSACQWWESHGLNELADKGDFRQITKVINGGYNHLAEREAIYARAKKVLCG